MTPNLKLTYFNFQGRGELARLVFHYGKIKFEDERLDFPTFGQRKPTYPFGQVPALTINDKIYAQSIAIARYGAKLAGIYPTNPEEALKVDMIVDAFLDIQAIVIDIHYVEKDENKKNDKIKKLKEEQLPGLFNNLEKLIEGKYFLGDDSRLSLADIEAYNFVEYGLKMVITDVSMPKKLKSIVENIKTHPNLANYLSKSAK